MALSLKNACATFLKGYITKTKYVSTPILNHTVRWQHKQSNNNDENCDPDSPISDMPNPFEREKTQCILCKYGITPDYKNVKLLSQFQSPYTGRVYGKHITRLCTSKQKKLENEIIKAQMAGLMANYLKEPRFLADPRLFDPERPIRQHRFE